MPDRNDVAAILVVRDDLAYVADDKYEGIGSPRLCGEAAKAITALLARVAALEGALDDCEETIAWALDLIFMYDAALLRADVVLVAARAALGGET
jgi:hypothetical protein